MLDPRRAAQDRGRRPLPLLYRRAGILRAYPDAKAELAAIKAC